jgi:small subunit ribosomal protein S6
MRSYELVFIVHPETDGDDLTAVIETVENLVKRSGGKVTLVKPWGLRRLAYPIQEQREGQYVLMQLEMGPQTVAEVERGLGLVEQVIRHLVVRIEVEEESKVEESKVEESKVEESIAEESKAEENKVEASIAEASKAEENKAEASTAEASTAEEASTESSEPTAE